MGKKWPRRAGTHALPPCPMSMSICPPFSAQPFPSLPQLRPLALKTLNQLYLVHTRPGKLASPIAGRPRVRQGFSYLDLCPCPQQRMYSRPTAQSSKSMQPPHHLAQPLPAVVSEEPVRSALPVRCQAWLRTTRHPALPRVSAIPEERAIAVSHWQ